MAKQAAYKSEVCTCKPGMGLWGLIMLAVGIYFVVLGFIYQTGNPQVFWNWQALLYYLIGIALHGFGHMCKHNAYHVCSMHGLK